MQDPQILRLNDNESLAYHKTKGKGPGVIFLGGFRSDMTGTKALALEKFCQERGQQFIRFDYRGHGQSSGKFEDCRIGMWKDDVIKILDEVADGPQILVGSSMGGWIMLLAALERPQKVAGLVGIAAAPDFTELLMWDQFTPEQQAELRDNKIIEIPNCYDEEPYPISLDFIAESGNHLVLDSTININCPVHLVHGLNDEDVPWEFSVTLNEKLKTKDVKTTLVDDGDHRMSNEKQLRIITKALNGMIEKLTA
jgi:pimeloyl-ACP methyl ester carboxylesterase